MPYNSTIIPKQKICVSCGKPCFWFSKKRCAQCSKIEDTHAKIAAAQEQEDGLSELIERLDKLVSKWVRFSAPRNGSGEIQCYTCSYWCLVVDTDAGHYISRNCLFLRFDATRNIRPQCHTCNRHKYGQHAIFGKKLEEEHPGITEILLEESRIIHKWSREELKQMILEFEQKVKTLKNH